LPAKVSGASRYRALDPVKDIESVHPIGAGLLALGQPRYVPSTPASVFHLVDRYLVESGRDPAQTYDRSNLGVVGRSANVGKPALMLAMERGRHGRVLRRAQPPCWTALRAHRPR